MLNIEFQEGYNVTLINLKRERKNVRVKMTKIEWVMSIIYHMNDYKTSLFSFVRFYKELGHPIVSIKN